MFGIGRRDRGDDAAGLLVAGFLARRLPQEVSAAGWEGDPTGLLDAWDGAERVWLADAVSSGAPAGTLHRIEAGAAPLPATHRGGTTHQLGLAETVELGRALGRLPRHVVVYGVEGSRFGLGVIPSPPVRDAARRAARAIQAEVACYCS